MSKKRTHLMGMLLLISILNFSLLSVATGDDNEGLEAEFTFLPDYPHVDETVTFDASESTGDIVSYEWDFGDGTPKVLEASPITTHAYTAVGEYDVTLNVTDSAGLWDMEDEDVEVELKYKVTLTVKSTVTGQTLFERTFKGWEEDAEMEIPTPLYNAMVAQFGTDTFSTPFSVIICETLNFTATSEPAGLTITYKPEDDGDVIDDDIVDIFDLIAVGVTFGSTIGAPDYDLLADLDFDYDIDVFDLIIIGVSFGDTYDCFTVTVDGTIALDVEIPEQEEPYTITIPPADFTAALPNWINPGIYPAIFEGEVTISETEIWFIGEIKIKEYEYWALFKVENTYSELPLVAVDAEGELTTTVIAK